MQQHHPEGLALLAAIRAEPGEDTARLIYADWLDEHDEPARAEFIRLQVEVEGQPPDSTRRVELEARATALLAEHWIEWWTPVCDAIGWPRPQPRWGNRFARVLQALTLPAGAPFQLDSGGRICPPSNRETGTVLPEYEGFIHAEFRRGFPESIHIRGLGTEASTWCRRWARVAPITSLGLEVFRGEDWELFDGPHLAGVTACSVVNFTSDGVERFTRSAFLNRVNTFRLTPAPAQQLHLFSTEWYGRLRALRVGVAESHAGELLERVPLANLETLTVDITGTTWDESYLRRLATSTHLGRLRELIVDSSASPASRPHLHLADGQSLFSSGTLRGLQRLVIRSPIASPVFPTLTARNAMRALTQDANLPALEELRFEQRIEPTQFRELAEAPLLRQLRRLHVFFDETGHAILPLVDAVIPTKLELMTIETSGMSWRWKETVRARLGSRVRLIRSPARIP